MRRWYSSVVKRFGATKPVRRMSALSVDSMSCLARSLWLTASDVHPDPLSIERVHHGGVRPATEIEERLRSPSKRQLSAKGEPEREGHPGWRTNCGPLFF